METIGDPRLGLSLRPALECEQSLGEIVVGQVRAGSQRDGTLTVVKENSPTSFVVEQTVKTIPSAKTLTLDSKTNQILLIGAEFGPPPPPPPGGGRGRGRGQILPGSTSSAPDPH